MKIKMGMIGGGRGAFIGNVHRMAAALDGQVELVCGAFSSDPERSRLSGKDLGLADGRIYGSYEEMIIKESQLPVDVRMDFVSIVTPNHMHYAPAKMALEHGFHVVCDKPVCFNVIEAEDLAKLVEKTGLVFALTHNYTAYPMVKEARHLVRSGILGNIRKVVAEYPQGWLSSYIEADGQKQAAWRTDPSKSGIAGAMGDIGSHAENLVEFITGLKITELCADVSVLVPGRQLDDDTNVLLRFENGARGVLIASQISCGEENNLSIKVYGELGGMEWRQMEPNSLIVRWPDKPMQVYRTGMPYVTAESSAATRIPSGHPEGYLEAFANLYKNVAHIISGRKNNFRPDPLLSEFPTIADGLRGMKFIEKVIESGKSDKKWLSFE